MQVVIFIGMKIMELAVIVGVWYCLGRLGNWIGNFSKEARQAWENVGGEDRWVTYPVFAIAVIVFAIAVIFGLWFFIMLNWQWAGQIVEAT